MMADGACRIVNISSTVALTGYNGLSVYAASKAGAGGFTRSLAREVAKLDITVNALAPGFVDTELTKSLDDDGAGVSPAAPRCAACPRPTTSLPWSNIFSESAAATSPAPFWPSALATPPDRHGGRHARSPRTASPDAGSCFVRCTS
jgi:NAD(P)-dependent dehydrogenase (short-subunit alcohol dehydrogenase family)